MYNIRCHSHFSEICRWRVDRVTSWLWPLGNSSDKLCHDGLLPSISVAYSADLWVAELVCADLFQTSVHLFN